MFTIPQINTMLVALNIASKTMSGEAKRNRDIAAATLPLDPTKEAHEKTATACDYLILDFNNLKCNLQKLLLQEQGKRELEEKL